LYTLAAIGVAAKIFGADAVMSGGQSELRSLFVDEETSSRRVSSVSGALLCLAVLFPVYFITSSFMARINVPIAGRLVIAAVATSLLFGVIPGVAALIQRLNWRHAFGLHPAVLAAFTVAVLLGFTVWPLAHEIVLFTQWLGFSSITAEQFAQAQTLIDQLRTVSPVLVVACMAVAPAVFEELFFRGYLFQALASATLFGLFHVVSNGLLSPERFLPSTFMGLILGWLCYQSGSILPGIVLHGCHNGLLMMLGYYKEELAALGFGMEDRAHMPLGLIGLSLGTLVFGILFIAWLPRHRTQNASQSL
jgi:ABC-2 type transport system permease protein/sodium transport system permease protein